jgi:hypothetical protein
MTREEFCVKAIRDAEKGLYLPPGWWGKYVDVHGPHGLRVRFSSCWVLSRDGKVVSKHDSRAVAIAKARKLAAAIDGGAK